MPIHDEIAGAMQKRMMREFRRVKAAGAEMRKLTDAFQRYQELRQERNKGERRVLRLAALLYPGDMPQNEDTARLGHMISDIDNAPRKADLPLWEALEEYLAVVGEARPIDAADMLEGFVDRKVTRQAVESAVRRHPDIFQVRGHQGESLISLR
jgi:hypothetical protein